MNKQNIALVKEAVRGPMGDRVAEMSLDELRRRVHDQADRIGVYPPADPMLVDAVRACRFMVLLGYANPKAFVAFIYPKKEDILDLGYMNSWGESPEEYKKCRDADHELTCREPYRCVIEYTCKVCKIKWSVDSSD
jgi:hypothetical protein